MSSKLLVDCDPRLILPPLAEVIGLNEAIVLQQVHYWCYINAKAKKNYKDGHYWVYNSLPDWNKQFPWWGERTVKRTFANLKKANLLISGNFNQMPMDRTNWYRVNYEALKARLASPSGQIGPMEKANMARAIPENNTENITKNVNDFFSSASDEKKHVISSAADSDGIDILAFIDWYCTAYHETFGKPHPRIPPKQKESVIDELKAFLADHPEVGIEGLQDMVIDFFENVGSNDWHISHFATQGILQNRYYKRI